MQIENGTEAEIYDLHVTISDMSNAINPIIVKEVIIDHVPAESKRIMKEFGGFLILTPIRKGMEFFFLKEEGSRLFQALDMKLKKTTKIKYLIFFKC